MLSIHTRSTREIFNLCSCQDKDFTLCALGRRFLSLPSSPLLSSSPSLQKGPRSPLRRVCVRVCVLHCVGFVPPPRRAWPRSSRAVGGEALKDPTFTFRQTKNSDRKPATHTRTHTHTQREGGREISAVFAVEELLIYINYG